MNHFGLAMMLSMILFWTLLSALGIWLVARLFPASEKPSPPAAPRPHEGAAIARLRQRHAVGEIDRAEYEEALLVLSRARTHG